ncbi:hypothetical protein U6G28_02095 [Actinomycetaceae bacterium MB13-C1-2]|nr:hypothetical protein U6G28_02095 [Actinomycetaceae bacterium MB13-C1-2]
MRSHARAILLIGAGLVAASTMTATVPAQAYSSSPEDHFQQSGGAESGTPDLGEKTLPSLEELSPATDQGDQIAREESKEIESDPNRGIGDNLCGTVFALAQTAPNNILEVNPVDGSTGVVGQFTTDSQRLNGLALDGETSTFWAVQQDGTGNSGSVQAPKIYSFNAATGKQETFTGSKITRVSPMNEFVMGAFDPSTGHYYYAQMSQGTVLVYGFNTRTGQPLDGLLARIELPFGTNGDFAFDASGRLFIVSDNALYVVEPVVERDATGVVTLKAKAIASLSQDIYGSAAFGPDGMLYVGTGKGLVRTIDPASGSIMNEIQMQTEDRVGDFASCAMPYSVEVLKNLPAGRAKDNDQFGVRIEGHGLVSGNTGMTSGNSDGVQDANPENYAGPVAVRPGKEYQISETFGNKPESATDYTTTWACTMDGVPLANGRGVSGSFVVPDRGAAGAAISCVFTNTPLKPQTLSGVPPCDEEGGCAVRPQELSGVPPCDEEGGCAVRPQELSGVPPCDEEGGCAVRPQELSGVPPCDEDGGCAVRPQELSGVPPCDEDGGCAVRPQELSGVPPCDEDGGCAVRPQELSGVPPCDEEGGCAVKEPPEPVVKSEQPPPEQPAKPGPPKLPNTGTAIAASAGVAAAAIAMGVALVRGARRID